MKGVVSPCASCPIEAARIRIVSIAHIYMILKNTSPLSKSDAYQVSWFHAQNIARNRPIYRIRTLGVRLFASILVRAAIEITKAKSIKSSNQVA
jgi:hypothetical protein